MSGKRILLAETNRNDAEYLLRIFEEEGAGTTWVTSGIAAIGDAVSGHYDLVVSSLHLEDMDGIELVKNIQRAVPQMPVVLVSDRADIVSAVAAIKAGAMDFLKKPLSPGMAAAILMYSRNGSRRSKERDDKGRIITGDPEMLRLLEMAENIAPSRASVLILGESGTGKELFARYIHQKSDRKRNPFVAVNCAALPDTLLESELFGHEKGAFTGALSAKKGKFELADTGTILLDEIGEMDVALQAKLLRVLQEKEVDRIGSTRPVCVDVRIIATTNRQLEKDVEEGRFREDLFYRLNVIPFYLPPLRERSGDIPLLAEHFIQKYSRLNGKNVKGLTKSAIEYLKGMPLRGNVRELENMIERAVLLCSKDLIDESAFLGFSKPCKGAGTLLAPGPLPLKEMEKQMIFRALDRTNGNRTRAAQILGISVRTLRNKLNEYRMRMEENGDACRFP